MTQPVVVLVHPCADELTRREIRAFLESKLQRSDIELVNSPTADVGRVVTIVGTDSYFDATSWGPGPRVAQVFPAAFPFERLPAVQSVRIRCKYQRRLLGLDPQSKATP